MRSAANPISDCIVKQYGCSCPPDTCSAQPTPMAPVISFSWRDHLVTCLFIGALAGIAMFAVAARAEPYLKTQALDQQEQVKHG